MTILLIFGTFSPSDAGHRPDINKGEESACYKRKKMRMPEQLLKVNISDVTFELKNARALIFN